MASEQPAAGSERFAPTGAAARAVPRKSGVTLWHLALGLFAVACMAGALVVLEPLDSGYAGLTLLIGITVTGVALMFLLATGQFAPGQLPPRIYQSLADSDPNPMCLTGPDGDAIYANRAWRRMFGQTPTGGIVLPVVAFSGDEDSAQRIYKLVKAANSGQPLAEEIKLRGPMARSVRLSTTPTPGRDYAVWRVLETIRKPLQAVEPARQNVVVQFRPVETKPKDIVQPQIAGIGSTEASRRFQRLFATAPVGIAMLDARGVVLEANAAFLALAAPEAAGVSGRSFYDFLKDMSGAEMRVRLAAVSKGEALTAPVDVRFKSGSDRTAQLYASALTPGAESGDAAAVVYLIDTTDQTELETQFAQSQKMQAMGQLAGGVAHDFNNILTAMNGYADLLLLRHKAGDPSFADLMQIRNSGNRAARLVRHLLAFSRQQTLTPKVYPASDLIADLSEILKRLLTERIKLAHDFGRDLWPVRVDQAQFDNMIINLGVNARDAMPDGGTLTLRTRNVTEAESKEQGYSILTPGDYVLIEVADTGTGIAPENIAKIFEPFFTTKEAGHGTGLGLASVYGFVKQSGGFVFPDSELGKGTTFKIYLPRYVATPEQEKADKDADEAAKAAPTRDLTGMGTILLVEDDDSVRSLTARALEMRGYEVLKASGGEEALDIVRAFDKRIHLMISDVVMPGMDGPEVARIARTIRQDMRVIFMSGYAEDSFRKQAETDGAVHFLPKPFPLQELAAKVKDVMSAPD